MAIAIVALASAPWLMPSRVFAQSFSAGSDGTMGALVVNADTNLVMPPDGRFHFTTINVNAGATLRFTRNSLNTPVYLLATSNVLIQGTIDLSGGSPTASTGGASGPGGFDGGAPNGSGLGPGGGDPGLNDLSVGAAGSGSYSQRALDGNEPSTNRGFAYGSPLIVPMVGGSGGGGSPNFGGGGGGGAIVIGSDTRIEVPASGSVIARGGFGNGNAQNYGSGGGIRLLAPVVTGSGTMNVLGPNNHSNLGRVRVDTIDRSGINFNVPTANGAIPPPLSIGSFMTLLPPGNPTLSILSVGNVVIPEGTNSAVTVTLPFGSSSNQTVVVQARDFNDLFFLRLTITPQGGRTRSVGISILDNTGNKNPATITTPIIFPLNTPVTVQAWKD
jgi:hypothetical protein